MSRDRSQSDDDINRILSRYGLAAADASSVRRASSGFSAADVWRVETAAAPMCVRRWPVEHPGPARLAEMHAILRKASVAGCNFVPVPIGARDGVSTFVEDGGRLWEVTPWMPGQPNDTPSLTVPRRWSALAALASFHSAVASEGRNAVPQLSPGLSQRRELLERCLAGPLLPLEQTNLPKPWEKLRSRRDDYLSLFPRAAMKVHPLLVAAAAIPVVLQPCIRDIRCEHVLFTGDEVTGWVDYGAMRDEHSAVDVARLSSDLCDDRISPALAWGEYAQFRGPTFADPVGPQLVEAFVCSGILLSPYNWFRWILVEGRDFSDRKAVVARIDELLRRLRRMVETP